MSMNPKFQFVVASPIGPIGVRTYMGSVSGVEFLDRRSKPFVSDDPFATEVTRQLQDYFSGVASLFSLPLSMSGSDFQQRVWRVLSKIKPGHVRTYGDIATELHTSARAVGNACRRNPIPIIIPCHRVISVSGIGGFSGATKGRHLDIKRWLLAHEGICL